MHEVVEQLAGCMGLLRAVEPLIAHLRCWPNSQPGPEAWTHVLEPSFLPFELNLRSSLPCVLKFDSMNSDLGFLIDDEKKGSSESSSPGGSLNFGFSILISFAGRLVSG